MAGLISAALKAEITATLDDVWDSFARDVTVTFYKTPTHTIVAADPDYNADFMENMTIDGVTQVVQSQTFTCRLKYLERQEGAEMIGGGDDTGAKSKFYYNRVKLSCKADAFAYLQDSERFEFLGEKYRIEDAWRRIGVLDSFVYYSVTLQRVN